MPSEVPYKDTQARVTPEPGKGALGARRPWIVMAPRHCAGFVSYSLTMARAGVNRNRQGGVCRPVLKPPV
jgi:hypothetical protein